MQTKIKGNEKNANIDLVKKIYIKYALTLVALAMAYGLLMFLVNQGIIDNYILRIMKQVGFS